MVTSKRSVADFGFAMVAAIALFGSWSNPVCAQSVSEDITIEVTVLEVTEQVASEITDLVGREGFSESGTESVTTRVHTKVPPAAGLTPAAPKRTSEGRSRNKTITKSSYQKILGIVRSSQGSDVSKVVKTSGPTDHPLLKFHGTARPYHVVSTPAKGQFGSAVDVPVYDVIEEGLIIKHNPRKTANGVELNSTIVDNQVVEVNTFTYTGAAGPITVQMPTTRTRELNFRAELPRGKLLLVESRCPGEPVEVRVEQRLASNIPYVNRLFKNVGIIRGEPRRMLFLISASEADSR